MLLEPFVNELGPWLAVAGVGALHGLNPVTGWPLAAACGLRSRDEDRPGPTAAWLALLPMAAGHLVSVAWVVGVISLGLALDRALLQWLAGGLWVIAVGIHVRGRGTAGMHRPAGHLGLALWSCMASTAHGAGLMLVPALMPLCLGVGPAADVAGHAMGASGALGLALAAVAVHGAAMLAVTGLMAAGACHGVERAARYRQAASCAASRAWASATGCRCG